MTPDHKPLDFDDLFLTLIYVSHCSGRFGHAIPHQNDHFERAYYEKHPELVKKEAGQYGEGRGEWALSSDDLNKIVRNTASRGAGLGKKYSVYFAIHSPVVLITSRNVPCSVRNSNRGNWFPSL